MPSEAVPYPTSRKEASCLLHRGTKCLFIFDVIIVLVTQWIRYKYTDVPEERAASILRFKSAFFIKAGTFLTDWTGVKSTTVLVYSENLSPMWAKRPLPQKNSSWLLPLLCTVAWHGSPILELCSCEVQSGSEQFYDKFYAHNRPLNQNVFDIHSYFINFFMLVVSKRNISVNATQTRPVRQDKLRVKSSRQLSLSGCNVRRHVSPSLLIWKRFNAEKRKRYTILVFNSEGFLGYIMHWKCQEIQKNFWNNTTRAAS
jgi:hypothetical protein